MAQAQYVYEPIAPMEPIDVDDGEDVAAAVWAEVMDIDVGGGGGAAAAAGAVEANYEALVARLPEVINGNAGVHVALVGTGYTRELPMVLVGGMRLVLLTHVQAVLENHRGPALAKTRDLFGRR